MKKHLPWIVVTVATLVLLAGLHFVVFSPLKTEYTTSKEDLHSNIDRLKKKIDSVEWVGEKPDPRKPDFSWASLLSDVEGTFDGRQSAFRELVDQVKVDFPLIPHQESTQMILERIEKLRELEAKHPNLRILRHWGLDTTSNKGYLGTRPLDLRPGGFVSYAGEDKIDGRQGTIQFAVNMEPWFNPDLADPMLGKFQQVLFHAGKQRPYLEGGSKEIHPGWSSEIKIERVGMALIAKAKAGPTEMPQTIDLSSILLDPAQQTSPWKVIKFTWGPGATQNQLYLDGKPSYMYGAMGARGAARGGASRNYAGGAPTYGGGSPTYGGGSPAYGGGVGAGFDALAGGAARYAGATGRPGQPAPGISLESLDGFAVGADLQGQYKAALQFDSVRIWDAIGDSGDPSKAPLFSEDFESPFGADEEFKRSMEQLVYYHKSMVDPKYAEEVQDQFEAQYKFQLGFANLSEDYGPWVNVMRTLSFLDHAIQTGAVRHGDMERLSLQVSVDIPDFEMRKHLIVFMDLAFLMIDALLESGVEEIAQIGFLNYTNTVSDEPLKKAFKDAFEKLQLDVTESKGMGGFGMGMGMMGMGYGGMPGYGGAPGYGGMPGYGGDFSSAPEDETEEEKEERRAKKLEEDRKAQEEAAAAMEKMMNAAKFEEKLERWKPYNGRNQIPPDFYVEYREQMAAEGLNFFLRYSLIVDYKCTKDKVAKSLHAMEYCSRLAFISQVGLAPYAARPGLLDLNVKVDYSFMSGVEDPAAAAVAPATGTAPIAAPPPSTSAGAGS